jgi:hypothetical protein
MGAFVAAHHYSGRSRLERRIPRDEVWIRADKWKDPRVKTHEMVEWNLMRRGVPYRRAHRAATKFEKYVNVK